MSTRNGKSDSSPKWKRRPDRRPSEIADAAIETFARYGYANTTMDRIADEAGVSKGTVYLYYKNKEDLLVKSIESRIKENQTRAFGILEEFDDSILTGDMLRLLLHEGLSRMLDILTSHPVRDALKIILTERPHSKKLRDMHAKMVRRGLSMLTGMLEKASKRGIIECPDPESAGKALLGMVIIFPLLREILGDKNGAIEKDEAFKAIFNFASKGFGLSNSGSD